ncbi:MAG: YdcF family protein [Sulfuricella sp.]|nr:YdcF family protein [Sulfuricella sp.]
MSVLLTNFIAAFLLPPLSFFVLGITGWLAYTFNYKRLGKTLALAAMILLWLASSPVVSNWLTSQLESSSPNKSDCQPQAIVVLGAGTYFNAPEYGGDTVTPYGLERLRLAAALHRKTGLPILISGGNPDHRLVPEAALMKPVLEADFSVPVKWTEVISNNTKENALYSRELLRKEGIENIHLITQAWHMPRSREAFTHAGFCVNAAPTGFSTKGETTPLSFLPQAQALFRTSVVIHEVVGILWYRLSR